MGNFGQLMVDSLFKFRFDTVFKDSKTLILLQYNRFKSSELSFVFEHETKPEGETFFLFSQLLISK